MNILLDTCIIIDALQDRHPFSSEARALIDAAALGYYGSYVTAKELTDIYYTMRNYYHSEALARNTISGLISTLHILDTTAAQIEISLSSSISDYEDAIMEQAALQNDLDCIVTRNLKDYKNSRIPALSPADCLKKLGIKSWS